MHAFLPRKLKFRQLKIKILSLLVLVICCLQANAQRQEKVDFIRAEALITPQPETKTIKAVVTYELEVLEKVNSIFLDAVEMNFSSVLLNHKKIDYEYADAKISIPHSFKKGKTYYLTLEYKVKPKQAVYFVGWDNKDIKNQIWTQGQGKYTSRWLPSFDDMNEKVEFDLNFTFDTKYKVIANGELKEVIPTNDSTNTWVYNMNKPMSSYLVAFAIGKYNSFTANSVNGTPLVSYYYPEDSLRIAATYKYNEEIFNFLEKEISISYPWINYKQVPVKDFLYAGMENTGTTIFSDTFMVDSIAFVDRNYVNVNAHELAHQWFGNLVTEQDGDSHWLHEGFATYYAYLAEKEVFGKDYFYWKLYDTAEELNQQQLASGGESLLNPKASSLTFYEKGAWALHMLRQEVGDKAFKKGIANYLKAYAFKNVEVQDFITKIEKASGKNLSSFQDTWLKGKSFPYRLVQTHLGQKLKSIEKLQELKEELKSSPSYLSKEKKIKEYWNQSESEELKGRIISNFYTSLSQDFLLDALNSEDIKIRQSIAKHTTKVSEKMKDSFESLLADENYVTQENALYALWSSFPDKRKVYLDKTTNLIGLPNKNIRLLWLTLAIVTPEYNSLKTRDYYKELVGYTSAAYAPEIRKGAFQFLNQTIGLDNESLLHLIYATNHHSWQFKKFARNLIQNLIQDQEIKSRLQALKKEAKSTDFMYVNSLLEK